MSSESGGTAQPTSINDLQKKMQVKGVVKKIELFGAFVDIGIGRDGLLHISRLSNKNVRNVSDVVSESQEITAWVHNVDPESGRVELTLLEPAAIMWDEVKQGATYEGTVARLEKFGAFIDIGAERPGLVHISEMSDGYVKSPGDVVQVGDKVEVRVLEVNSKKRRIGLSMKSGTSAPRTVVEETPEESGAALPTAMELALRRAMQGVGDDGEIEQTGKQTRRSHSKKRRREQDDIISRTLQHHSQNN